MEGIINQFAPKEESSSVQKLENVVLVVGATGGVGKRVVDELKKKGYKVRALVSKFGQISKYSDVLHFHIIYCRFGR